MTSILFLIETILTQLINMKLSQKQKAFSWIFFAFLKSILAFEHFQKVMNLIADGFPKLLTTRNMVR